MNCQVQSICQVQSPRNASIASIDVSACSTNQDEGLYAVVDLMLGSEFGVRVPGPFNATPLEPVGVHAN